MGWKKATTHFFEKRKTRTVLLVRLWKLLKIFYFFLEFTGWALRDIFDFKIYTLSVKKSEQKVTKVDIKLTKLHLIISVNRNVL